jgi:hypothetical protein
MHRYARHDLVATEPRIASGEYVQVDAGLLQQR